MEEYSKKVLVRSIIMMVIMCAIIYFAVTFTGMDKCKMVRISPDDITGDITTASGEVISGLHPYDWRLSRGDTLTAKIQLPRQQYADSTLCFSVYNSAVKVEYSGSILYSYGFEHYKNNRQIGDILVCARIPNYAWGRAVILTIKEQERTKTLQNSSYYIVPSERATSFPVVGHGLEFVIFFVLMIVGCGLGISGFVFVTDRKNRTLLSSIGIATFLLCCWYFGYNRFFYSVSTNIHFNAMIEYYALDLVSIPIIVFVYNTIENDGIRKKIVAIVGIFVLVYSVGSLILSGARVIMLSDALPGLQVILAGQLIILVWLAVTGARRNKNGFEASLLVGITTGMGFAVIEVVAIRIRNWEHFPRALLGVTSFNFASVGLAILILTLIIGVVEKLYHDLRTRTEQEELEKLAYIDQLTGIPNRISCTNKMRDLTTDQWYAVAFFDVDGLKAANDNYGHDVGDALIKEAAGLISIAFGNRKGFYGRWGGDEFVAVFLDKSSYSRFDLVFGRYMDYVTKKNRLPVPFSISVGYMEHTQGSRTGVNDIVNQADERMYYNKKCKKKERKA